MNTLLFTQFSPKKLLKEFFIQEYTTNEMPCIEYILKKNYNHTIPYQLRQKLYMSDCYISQSHTIVNPISIL